MRFVTARGRRRPSSESAYFAPFGLVVSSTSHVYKAACSSAAPLHLRGPHTQHPTTPEGRHPQGTLESLCPEVLP
jgi:hypothetical protein